MPKDPIEFGDALGRRIAEARAKYPDPHDWLDSLQPGLSEYGVGWSTSEAAFLGGVMAGLEVAEGREPTADDGPRTSL